MQQNSSGNLTFPSGDSTISIWCNVSYSPLLLSLSIERNRVPEIRLDENICSRPFHAHKSANDNSPVINTNPRARGSMYKIPFKPKEAKVSSTPISYYDLRYDIDIDLYFVFSYIR